MPPGNGFREFSYRSTFLHYRERFPKRRYTKQFSGVQVYIRAEQELGYIRRIPAVKESYIFNQEAGNTGVGPTCCPELSISQEGLVEEEAISSWTHGSLAEDRMSD